MTDTTTPPTLDRQAVRTALGLILVGGPIVIVDLRVSTLGNIDLLNDTLGYLLLLWASALLVRQPGPSASRLGVVAAITALALLWSVIEQVDPSLLVPAIDLVLSGLSVLATILFCAAMRDLSGFHGMPSSNRSWRQATNVAALVLGGLWVLTLVVGLLVSGAPFGRTIAVDAGGPAIVLMFLGLALVLIVLITILAAIITLRGELAASETAPPR